ncbi:hypothetical protein [Flavobacterium sp. 3HN19-14]|uniref:hypothetical protein n=1 Tax=Flavobacterium sp. 3HN19-14 TaxID=3448133 RepID=UPI003EE2CF2C
MQELLIDKVKDFQENQPENCAPEVDWHEFHNDYKDRKLAAQMLSMVKTLEGLLLDIRILRDHDNYKAALSEYKYVQYRNRFTSGSAGFEHKIAEIRQFFPKTGKKSKDKNP